jgi:putative tricarboxylic transport membrane protein
MSDVCLLLIVSVLVYGMPKLGFPFASLMLGIILGPIAEASLRRALMADADRMNFLTRAISLGPLVLAAPSMLWSVRHHLRRRDSATFATTPS